MFRVTRTLGTRLPPSWDTEMRVRISFCSRLRSTCERLLRLRFSCEPAFMFPCFCSLNLFFFLRRCRCRRRYLSSLIIPNKLKVNNNVFETKRQTKKKKKKESESKNSEPACSKTD